jgi:excinuclease UvrABC nuclease subunit
VPRVYFFHGGDGELLYIGQSLDLRERIGSYRHVTPEKNPKRTLKLVHRIVRIEWKECSTQTEAIDLERVLLLEHRPPFNRAGVWKDESGSPIVVSHWMWMEDSPDSPPSIPKL